MPTLVSLILASAFNDFQYRYVVFRDDKSVTFIAL